MSADFCEFIRYVLNGLVATGVHGAALVFNVHALKIPSAGIANALAALLGILVSFLGSRYFVFGQTRQSIWRQFSKFSAVYGALAVFHGIFLFLWTDCIGFDYRSGFLIAVGTQVMASYCANKHMVFTS